jgi:hypothetical protein
MSAEGKYTVYAPPMNEKNLLLNKLFRSNDPALAPPTQDLVGQEQAARAAVIAISKPALQPAHQTGDAGMFPQGVDLNFVGSPDLSTVGWVNAGDPANPYAPDISSPGPGKTNGTDKNVDPQLSATDLKPNYVPGAPKTGTKSPSTASPKVFAANELGTDTPDGDSGANI